MFFKSSTELDDWQNKMEKCADEFKEKINKLNKENAEDPHIKSLFRSIDLALTFEAERSTHLENAKNTITEIQKSRPDLKKEIEAFDETFQSLNKKKPKYK